MLRSISIVVAGLVATAPEALEAQRRAAGTEGAGTTEVGIVAEVGSRNYTSRVAGTCEHEPSASIYDVPAALWMVRAEGSDRSEVKRLSLTLWRPKDGSADQLSITFDAGARPVSIKVNPRGRPAGAATVQVEPRGPGAKFEVRGKDAAGTRVNLTITCPVLAGVEAEGG